MKSVQFNLPKCAAASYLAGMKSPAEGPVTLLMYCMCLKREEGGRQEEEENGTRGRRRWRPMKGRGRSTRRHFSFLFMNSSDELSCRWHRTNHDDPACRSAASCDCAQQIWTLRNISHLLICLCDIWRLLIGSSPTSIGLL